MLALNTDTNTSGYKYKYKWQLLLLLLVSMVGMWDQQLHPHTECVDC
jgi:hypothetical protein